jgi:hypothetical protein
MIDTSKTPHDQSTGGNPQEQANNQPSSVRKALDVTNKYADLIIAISTVFMAVLTFILAYMAIQQNDVAQRALELNSRPYISISLEPRSITTQSGQKMRMYGSLRNSGGIPADIRMRGMITHSLTKLSAPSLDMIAEVRDIIFPKDPNDNMLFIYSPATMTDGQVKDMADGTGWLYVRILIIYGIYHTETCVEYKLLPTVNGKGVRGDFTAITLCDDPKATSAN